MATRLPVNASSEGIARRIAADAAATLPPKGFTLTVGEIVATETPARPFEKVALQEQNVPAERLSTYVFEAEIGRESADEASGREAEEELRRRHNDPA